MIFYAFVIVLATVASAPVGNDGLDGDTTLCDFTTEDCPLVFNSNDYTAIPTGLNQASGGAGGRAEVPSAFSQLNSFTIANSDSLVANGFDPKSYAPTYECDDPLPVVQDPNFFLWPSGNESPVTLYLRRDSATKLPVDQDTSNSISCTKCRGPKDSDCTPVIANCGSKQNPYGCYLCETKCEFVADISKLPSRGNPYGQSWCKTGECRAWGQHCDPLSDSLTLDCL